MNTEEALNLAGQLVEQWDWDTETHFPEPERLDVYIKNIDDLVPIIVAMRVKRLGYLAAITGLDLGTEAGEFEVLYHFCTAAAVITLRVRIPRDGGAVPSLGDIIPSAEPFERELREMFGIEVTGLRTPMKLYLPDDWPDDQYPLRKDSDEKTMSEQTILGEI